MNFFTHLLISETLYRKLSKKLDIDRKAFRYGNIKPDLSPQCIRRPHVLENYLLIIQNDANRLTVQGRTSGERSRKEFSADLGVICHFICDFFCYCHLNQELYHRLFRHFFYELQLHLYFCRLLLGRRFRIRNYRNDQGKNIAAMIMKMRKEYHTQKITPKRDLDYAVMTSLWACELICSLSVLPSETSEAVSS